jgi:neutral ceramidase
VTLVLQGAVGNVSVALREPGAERLERFVSSLASALDGVSLTPAPAGLAVARATVDLPGPDASRIVPRLVRPLTDNVFCAASPATADVSLLRLGPLVLLGVPGEPTAAAARVLEAAAGAGRVVSLVNGYLGYAETPAHLATGEGEAERQLLRPEFLEVLAEGGRKARSALQ